MSQLDSCNQNVLLTAEGLSKHFGQRVALEHASFSIAAGDRVAVLGANGAGKTTLLSLLTRVYPPDLGTLVCACRIGWVPQQLEIYHKLSARENLLLFAHLEGVDQPAKRVEDALVAVDLADRAEDLVENLSGGMRQRVNLAVGLLHLPELLVLDEPSAALDPLQRERLWQLLDRRAQAGSAVMFSTHVLSEALDHADRLLILAKGRMVFYGTCSELPGYQNLGSESALLKQIGNG